MSWTASDFEHSAVLKENIFTIYWNNLADDKIDIGVECVTSGWCAIGISPNGNMINSDIMLMWVSNGNAYLQNRNTITDPSQNKPELNNNQGYFNLTSGSETNGVTKFRFTRDKYPCDTAENLKLSKGTTRLIWAYQTSDPADEAWSGSQAGYHGTNRGSKSINFESGSGFSAALPNDYSTVNLTMTDYTIPTNVHTMYYCKLMKLPVTSAVQHIIKYEPIFTPGNEVHLHHFVIYQCPHNNIGSIDSYLNSQQTCGDVNNMPIGACRGGALVYAWAVGQEAFSFPEHVGLEMSGPNPDLQYILLEVHYDIPSGSNPVLDNSGVRVYYTPTLRANNASTLWVGLPVDKKAQFIPPGMTETTNYAYCPAQCLTNSTIDQNGLKVFATSLHEHTTGVGAVLRHIRNGVELKPIDKNEDYDFNYQEYVRQVNETVILPGDDLILECNYSTTSKSAFIAAGESTGEEMCMVFMMVYPKPVINRCNSQHKQAKVEAFWNDANSNGYTNANYTTANANSYTTGITWTNDNANAVQFYDDYWKTSDLIQPNCKDHSDNNVLSGVNAQQINVSSLLPGAYTAFVEDSTCATASTTPAPTTAPSISAADPLQIVTTFVVLLLCTLQLM